MRDVVAVVNRLPRSSRDVLELVIWDELTYEQAATALGIPVGTVRSRLSRARKRLAELAAKDGVSVDGADPNVAVRSACEHFSSGDNRSTR
jgi:RNA polymerase sigma-70 factor (ECF subfamily)